MKSFNFTRYEPVLQQSIDEAFGRIEAALAHQLPLSQPYIRGWLKQLSGTDHPADYFRRAPNSPILWFPRFLEKRLNQDPVSPIQNDLIYSTINGYYYIRLIDNLMDHEATSELEILPALGFFHTQFQIPYQKYFVHDHPFWDHFQQVWFHSADVTILDTKSAEQNQNQFDQIASQKICAIKIPLTAVAYYYGTPELILPWSQFVDRFGRWHQMQNDLFHWYEDLAQGIPTFFLAEANRRKLQEESLPDWVLREGFLWGLDLLDEWMTEMQRQTLELRSSELDQYLGYCQMRTRKAGPEVVKALYSASKIKSLLF